MRITPSGVACDVPGCDDGKVTEDCCLKHSLSMADGGFDGQIPNDGLIDWLAIDIASRGLRRVRLTWVEKDIAVGAVFARGYGVEEAQERTGARVSGNPRTRRVRAARKIAESGVLERLEAELGCANA